MADIDIQEKKGSPWPWIIGLLALVLVVWGIAEMMGGDDEEFAATVPAAEQPMTPMEGPDMAVADMPAEVTQFEEQCADQSAAQDEMSLSHEYTESCVQRLTAALAAVISRDTVNGTALAPQLEEHRARANQLTQDRESPQHSSLVREVFTGAAALISRIEETREGTTDALERRSDRVQEAAEAVSADRPTLEQRDEVATFFNEAAAALRAMATDQRR